MLCTKIQNFYQNVLRSTYLVVPNHDYLVGVPDMSVDVVSVGERLVTKQAFGRFLELEV